MQNFFELPDDTKNSFPKHGWVASSSGRRQLRLPILRLYQLEAPHRDIYATAGLAGIWLQCRSPYASLRQLGVALRDLHVEIMGIAKVLRAEWFDKSPSEERDVALTKYLEGTERAEILLIAAFVLLRRLADHMIDATRPILFTDWQSAPRLMKVAVAAAKAGKLVSLKPVCDLTRLEDALINRTQWFDNLRQEDGIRDILVHKEHIFQVGGQGRQILGNSETAWGVTAHLTRVKAGEVKVVDALPALRDCIVGLCDFLEYLYRAVGIGENYERGDLLALTGDDGDVTGFWPSITKAAHSDA